MRKYSIVWRKAQAFKLRIAGAAAVLFVFAALSAYFMISAGFVLEALGAIDPKKSFENYVMYLEQQKKDNQLSRDGALYNRGFNDSESGLGSGAQANQGGGSGLKSVYDYYGVDANCQQMGSENERSLCISKHPFWGEGTLRLFGNLIIKGVELGFKGFDLAGNHWIVTGTAEPMANAIGFSRFDSSLFLGRHALIKDDLIMSGGDGDSFYFGPQKQAFFQKEGQSLLMYRQSAKVMDLSGQNEEYRIKTNQDLGIPGYLKTDQVIFRDSALRYCVPGAADCAASSRSHSSNFIYKPAAGCVVGGCPEGQECVSGICVAAPYLATIHIRTLPNFGRRLDCGDYGIVSTWYLARGRCGETEGIQYWRGLINACGTDSACVNNIRNHFNTSFNDNCQLYFGVSNEDLCNDKMLCDDGDDYRRGTAFCDRH